MAEITPSFTRRAVLTGLGAGAGLWLTRGLGAQGWREAGAAPRGASTVLRQLGASLTPGQRELLVLPSDHPTRQITNTISVIERPHLGTLLSPRQQALVGELAGSMLSARGRRDFAGTFAVEGRFEGCVLALYGDPESPDAHAVLQGGHLMLRSGPGLGGDPAFGGAVAYGHQIGNELWRVPGNSFAWHGDAANALFASLSSDERARAVLPRPPHELVLQVRGPGVALPGVRIGALSDTGREAAAGLVDAIFAAWPEAERAHAHACLVANGGLEALHFSVFESKGFYSDMRAVAELDAAERARRGDPYWQVWRLEGPGAVLHFQGHPHVHAYVNVVRDPARANLGETLGQIPRTLDGSEMRRVLEAALRRATGEALAWHGEHVPGRFCAGPVTTGLAYALDPYANRVVVATLEGRAMSEGLRAHLTAEGVAVEPRRPYRIATIEYLVFDELLGDPTRVETSDLLLRDALVAHLRSTPLA